MKGSACSLALCLCLPSIALPFAACAHTQPQAGCELPPKSEAPAAPAPAASAAAASPSTAGQPPAALDAAALHGSWVEFWALSGRTETERYTFLPDGRFGWNAAASVNASPAHRWGRYRVEGNALVLSVQGEDARSSCDGSSACRAAHEPPAEQRIALGACPANDEAQALDKSYRCISLADQAFWSTQHPAEPQADFAALAR